MKIDRQNVYRSVFEPKDLHTSLMREFEEGKKVIETESISGAKRFVNENLGRHGKFNLKAWDEIMKKNRPQVKSVLLDDEVTDDKKIG